MSWTTFDPDDDGTWPPLGELVIIQDEAHGYCIRFLDLEYAKLPYWYDEHGSADEGYRLGLVTYRWHLIPPDVDTDGVGDPQHQQP